MRAIISTLVNIAKSRQSYTNQTLKYLKTTGLRPDPIRSALNDETIKRFGIKSVMSSDQAQCELFESLLRFSNAKHCLEIGVFTGASALSIARGIGENGKLVALDISEEFTDIAKKYWKMAKVDDRIDLIIGPASKSLNTLLEQGKAEHFDFAYIDADKTGYLEYYELVLKLIRKGGMIAFDNVLLFNQIADSSITTPDSSALRVLNQTLLNDTRVKNFILPIADGINIVTKL